MGRAGRSRGLSRGSLPVRNTGEMGAWPVSSVLVFCGTPGWQSVADKKHGDVRICILETLCYEILFWWVCLIVLK